MKLRTREPEAQDDLFRARLEQIINMDHALVRLAGRMDWAFFDETFGARTFRPRTAPPSSAPTPGTRPPTAG